LFLEVGFVDGEMDGWVCWQWCCLVSGLELSRIGDGCHVGVEAHMSVKARDFHFA